MAGGSTVQEGDYNTEINVVPLVDIMLVLLIIFILTVPVATKAVRVDLPKELNEPTETKPEDINISVDFTGTPYWNDSNITIEGLRKFARIEAGKDPQPDVHIRADRRVYYESVQTVMKELQQAGILRISFIAEQPTSG
jgi:biopolymer transport protein ExbD